MPGDNSRLPIDRGYAWVVVAASCCLFALSTGGLKCQGVILVELIERYEGVYSPSTLLWVFSICPIVSAFTGPLVSMLLVKLSHRTVAIMGVLLLALSNVSLAYSTNLPTMFLLHSLPGGMGIRLVVLPAVLVVGQYFHKYKALSIGIVASGCGVGTLVIPYILRPLFDYLDFAGALLAYAGFTLQFVLVSMLLRPISYYERTLNIDVDKESDNSHRPLVPVELSKESDLTSDYSQITRPRSMSFNRQITSMQADKSQYAFHSDSVLKASKPPTRSYVSLLLGVYERSPPHYISIGDISGSVFYIDKMSSSTLEDSSLETSSSAATTTSVAEQDQFNWKILLMPKYIMYCLSLMFYHFGAAVVYQCIPTLAAESGVAKSTVALAIMLAGGLEIPCRIVNGFLVDKKIMAAVPQHTLCLVIAGILTLICAIVSGLPGVIIVLIGMSSAGTSYYSLMILTIGELIGYKDMTTAMGLQSPITCIGMVGSTFISGYIYDQTGSWRVVYFYLATMILLGSVVMMPYCLMVQYKQRCANNDTTESNICENTQFVKDDSKRVDESDDTATDGNISSRDGAL